jgi:hypothetical protein
VLLCKEILHGSIYQLVRAGIFPALDAVQYHALDFRLQRYIHVIILRQREGSRRRSVIPEEWESSGRRGIGRILDPKLVAIRRPNCAFNREAGSVLVDNLLDGSFVSLAPDDYR